MDEPPQIQDDPGREDERFARLIIALPFVLGFVFVFVVIGLVLSGAIPVDVRISGTLSAEWLILTILRPILLVFSALVGLVYLLAVAKEWGVKPVRWVGRMARNYNPDDDESN